MNRYSIKSQVLFALFILLSLHLNVKGQTVGEIFTEDIFTFTVLTTEAGGCTVELTDGKTAVGAIEISAMVEHEGNTYKIVSIGNEAFKGAKIKELNLTGAVNLQRIGASAFAECKQLVKVQYPAIAESSITEIGPLAFHHCRKLESFNIEDTRIRVLESLFSENEKDEISFSKLTSLKLPQSLRIIRKYALQFLDITDIDIPSGVVTFEDRVLEGCIFLKNFTWKNAQVTSIPEKTFLGDDQLDSVSFLTMEPIEPDGLKDSYFKRYSSSDLEPVHVYVTPESYDNLLSGGYTKENSVFTSLEAMTDWLPAQRGDANGDGSVNAADIVEVVNYIMGNESDCFLFKTADMNSDGSVNAADIVLIVNTIMSN